MTPTPERSTEAASSPAVTAPDFSPNAKPRRGGRVPACVRCQQRHSKCDREFPCANCVKSNTECVPAATLGPRQRRRRFPERELLDRVRHQESLLRQNSIQFEPLHSNPSTIERRPRSAGGGGGSRSDFPYDEQSGAAEGPAPSDSRSTGTKPETAYEARYVITLEEATAQDDSSASSRNFWQAMNQRSRDSEDDHSDTSSDIVREAVVKSAWNQLYPSNDHLLFDSRKSTVNLSTLHPDQVGIFRLWQVYLDNVNPLLKVTHTPTLQGRIIDSASNLASIKPTLAALMFGIYCVAILSLADDECYAMFGSPKDQLLTKYQFGCEQALSNCGFLRSGDRECLTAFYLYLISIRPGTDPRSVSSMLSPAIRIAQRMGLHRESAYAKCSPLEAEMRRRLWWSLVMFDTRMCEMADYKSVMLVPTWDCTTPRNVNDFDLQPEMKELPPVHENASETVFAVVRSEMGEFVRHSAFHLNFVLPALKTIAKDVQHGPVPDGGEVVRLDNMIEHKYLRFCNPENSLHFMTIWMARGQMNKNRLVETYSKFLNPATQQTDAQRDTALSYALQMLECDTMLMASPLTKGYLWFIQTYFPFPAYIHICQDLRRRPISKRAGEAWETLSNNYKARFEPLGQHNNPFVSIFANMVLQAWEARMALSSKSGESLVPPRILSYISQKVVQPSRNAENATAGQPSDVSGMSMDDPMMSMLMDFGGPGMLYGMGGQSYEGLGIGHGQAAPETDLNQFDCNVMDWNPMYGGGW